jgi:hypothetical protein
VEEKLSGELLPPVIADSLHLSSTIFVASSGSLPPSPLFPIYSLLSYFASIFSILFFFGELSGVIIICIFGDIFIAARMFISPHCMRAYPLSLIALPPLFP